MTDDLTLYQEAVQALITHAAERGIVVTVEPAPRKPLAMGNFDLTVSARKARHQPQLDGHGEPAFDLDKMRSDAMLRELEAEVLEQCRLNGMGAERELALMRRVRELEGERDALSAVMSAAADRIDGISGGSVSDTIRMLRQAPMPAPTASKLSRDELAGHAVWLANSAPPVSTKLAASWMPNAINILRQCAAALTASKGQP